MDTKKDAFSLELQQYCYSQPVVVIRGLAGALKLGKEEYVKLNIKIKLKKTNQINKLKKTNQIIKLKKTNQINKLKKTNQINKINIK